MKKYNYLAGTLAIALVFAFSSCKKDDSLEGLMSKPETTVSSASAISSAPVSQPGGANDTISNTACRCPSNGSSPVN